MTTVLVTGGAGFIATHTDIELLDKGYDVISVDNYGNSSPVALERVEQITGKPVKRYDGDVRDEALMERVFTENNIDWVIHFAGLKAVGESVAKPIEYYDNNLYSTLVLLKVMKKHNVKKIIFSSSATVYGTPKELPITEETPTGGTTNPYGTSKLFQEQILRDVHVADPSWTIVLLRYFNPVGAHESGLLGEDPKGIPANLTPYVAKVAVGELKEVQVYGDDYDTPDGTGVRDYIHVVDLAKGHVAVIDHIDKEGVFVYNLGTGHGYSVLEVIKAYEKAAGHPIPYAIKPRRPGDIAACYADASKAEKELGWKAELTIDDMPITVYTATAGGSVSGYAVQSMTKQGFGGVGRLMGGEGVAGKRILDLCAAPGGKTTLYASLAGPDGLVVANEIDRRRAQVLADNVRKWGTGNVAVTTCEPRQLGDFEAWFDMVAVDAPCSGEGMFRKDAQARAEWSEGNVKLCAARQDGILREAWRALKPGGRLIYSTCTFNRDEDEGALERMLAWAGDEVAEAEDMAVDGAWGIVCGRVGAFRTYRFYPYRARGEGFFAAVACKAYDAGGRCRTPKARRTVFAQVDKASAAELRRWVRTPERMCFAAGGGTRYGYYVAQAEAVKALGEALPVIYAGVAMGQFFKGSLRPDPALAFFCGLNREAVSAAELDEAQALCYLRRQEVAAGAFAEGVNLVCARGRALGFAKRIGNRVNNMYPNTLRIIKR